MYFGQFIEHGYDDIEDIINMSDPRIEMLMNLTGIAKKDGHKGRFLAAIHLVRTRRISLDQQHPVKPTIETQQETVDYTNCKLTSSFKTIRLLCLLHF